MSEHPAEGRLKMMTKRVRRRRRKMAALACSLLITSYLCTRGGSLATSGPASTLSTVTLGEIPHLPMGTRITGKPRPQAILHLDFLLAPTRPTAMAALAQAVATPANTNFHHYLSPDEFAARFGASTATLRAVRQELRSLGMRPQALSADRLSLAVVASARTVERAFHPDIAAVRAPGDAAALVNLRAPRVPAALGAHLIGILGLDTLRVSSPALPNFTAAHSLLDHSGAAASPHLAATCAGAAALNATGGTLTASDVAAAYAMDPLYATGDTGMGSTVAVIEFSPIDSGDIAAFDACYGISPNLQTVDVDGGATTSDATSEIEAELDIEQVEALAPGANIMVYEGANNNGVTSSSAYDTFRAAIDADTAQVITTSWGSCEPAIGKTASRAENVLFEQAALQGQSVVAASGDAGAQDCLGSLRGASGSQIAVDDPAAQPFVTGVGGTELSLSPSRTEIVWNTGLSASSPGATGGGLSRFWTMPDYQLHASAALNVSSVTSLATSCAGGRHECRAVPDLALDAGTPYAFYCTVGRLCDSNGWTPIGGTSAAAPALAAMIALADALPSCTDAPLGFINPSLYSLSGAAYATSFTDITSGDNDLLGSNGGNYVAGPAYDLASGLGSPLVGDGSESGLVAALCHAAPNGESGLPRPSVLGLSRHTTGRSSGGTVIEVRGVHLSGTLSVRLGGVAAKSFHVLSDSLLRVVTPPGHGAASNGAAHLRVTTRAGTSAASKVDLFTYLNVPEITAVTSAGSLHEGSRVEVTGRFLRPVLAVRVGRASAAFRSLGGRSLLVTLPPGSGRVALRVRTSVGWSAPIPASYLSYREGASHAAKTSSSAIS